MQETLSYDVFLSHSSKDKAIVRPLAKRLKADGIRVWFDEWNILPGDSIPAKIEEGLEFSRVLILCMSANAFGSDWAQLESGTFRFRDPLNKMRRFIPLRLDNAPIKGSLAQYFYIEWLSSWNEEGYMRLADLCRPTNVVETAAANGSRIQTKNGVGRTPQKSAGSSRRVSEATIKRLFGMSRNQCAIPDCKSPIIMSDSVVGDICYIRGRSKRGHRYDPLLTETDKNDFRNLILLCNTCQKLVDSNPDFYTVESLQAMKLRHERQTPKPLELTQSDAIGAARILVNHLAKNAKPKAQTCNVFAQGCTHASAMHGGVAVAISGPNHGNISIKVPGNKPSGTNYPTNSIGADANMTNYIEYLCDLYAKFMLPIEPDEKTSWAKLGTHIKTKFHLKKKTRNHLSVERFNDLVDFLVNTKIVHTPVGQKHVREGKRLCRTFDEFRYGKM